MPDRFVYREHELPIALRPYVRAIWELSSTARPSPAPELIVPDGCMEIVINFSDPFEQMVDGVMVQQPRVIVVGEIRRSVITRPSSTIDLLGVRFAPGAGSAMLDSPAIELVDGLHDDAAIEVPGIRLAIETVRGAEPHDRVRLLKAALVERVQRGVRFERAVRRCLDSLVARDGCVEISELHEELGITRRHLERRFKQVVGVSPKSFAQVLRFRRVLRAIEDTEPDWTGVALDCGYYDQSHLIRDFKRFTGASPTHYLRRDHPLTVLFSGAVPPNESRVAFFQES